MNAKPATKLKTVTMMLILIGVVIAAIGLIYLFGTPKAYRASAKVRVWKSGWNGTNDLSGAYDPTVALPGQIQLIRSDAIVDQAVRALGLNELWGLRYNRGVAFTIDQSRARLRSMVEVRVIPSTSILEIQVTSENRDETSTIANELMQAYHDHQQSQRQGLRTDKISSLKQAWEVQNQKVQEAQARLYDLSQSINKDRATNSVTITDKQSTELVQSKRIELEEEYVKQQSMLAKLKAMDRERLEEVLPVMDDKTNIFLMSLLERRNAGRTALVEVQADHGAESTEVKHATLIVKELDKRVSQAVDASLESMTAELAATKTTLGRLDEINRTMKSTRTNQDLITTQNSAYEMATNELGRLKQERDDLQEKMRLEDTAKDIMPMVFSAQIVETAQPPLKPATPDGKLALATISVGGCMAALGVLLILLARLPKSAPGKS
ncbi:MAG: hypothetical protein JWR26_3845 [Pedosphaera sp.]|nr:hypothetical protein [Pedosphaera sp.]